TGPERIDPGSERQDLLALVTSTEHDLAARLDRLGDGRLHQPSLADPRLALDHADRPAAVPGVGQPLAQRQELGVTPDQRGGRGDDRRHPEGLAGLRRPSPSLEKLAVQLFGLRLWFGAELALQRFDALLILAERGAAPALARVEAHERSMDRLLRAIPRQQAHRDRHRPVVGADPRQMTEELPGGLDGDLT